MISQFSHIHTREELRQASPKLRQLFNQLAKIMVAAQEFKRTHPSSETHRLKDYLLSDQLMEELNRIYQIDQGKEMIEKCQEEAVNLLQSDELKNDRYKIPPH